MSVNKVLKKRQQQSRISTQTNLQDKVQNSMLGNQQLKLTQHDNILEAQFQQFAEYSKYNPASYQFSNAYMPYNGLLYNRFKIPLSLAISPVSYEMNPAQKSIDTIPRCGSCRAYMNYYNKLQKQSFQCFLCGRQNGFNNQYKPNPDDVQLTYPSFHVLGGSNVYYQAPPENAFIFLIDISGSSYQSKALQYFVAGTKQVLSREQLNETQIYFYTYDESVHEYDFTGEEVKCIVLDQTIIKSNERVRENFVQNIRKKLFQLLDSLQEISQNNKKRGSRFYEAFIYVLSAIKHTGGKMFILQTNQNIVGEEIFNEMGKNANKQINPRPKSIIQTRNKAFFDTNISELLNSNISCSLFIFQKNYKNLRIFGDAIKLTNSEMFSYRVQSTEDLYKFYYDLTYLLSATYFSDVKMELISSPGWYFTAVYSNMYRIKQYITFKYCQLEPSRKTFVVFQPQEISQLPYFAFQAITNYLYNRSHYVTVNTVVLPLTTSLQKLYTNQDYSLAAATLHRSYLSSLRLQDINVLRNKFTKQMASIWKCANDFYKKKTPPQINNLMLSELGLFKSNHFQLERINNILALDQTVCQRVALQSCGVAEIQNYFNPYLFNLTNLTKDMCSDDENFIYPNVCELKFTSMKDGIYLLDNGLSLYLYITKNCLPQLLNQLFGKQKLSKTDILSQQSLITETMLGQQVANLIRVLRQQKSYGWVPLYIVRSGEGSFKQKNFYMNFYAEKYDQFGSCKLNLSEFIATLEQQY